MTATESSSGPIGPLIVSPIDQGEIDAAVRIFLDAFRDNVQLIYGSEPKRDAMRDVWTFVRDVEPGGFLAARNSGADLIGYAIFTHSIKALQRRALREGKIFVWAARALSGRYGIRWFHVGRLLWNKVLFVGGSARFRTAGDAQLLNIAVSACGARERCCQSSRPRRPRLSRAAQRARSPIRSSSGQSSRHYSVSR